MIVAERKPFAEIEAMVAQAGRVLVIGCGTCGTGCFSGGTKQVAALASALRIATRIDGKEKVIEPWDEPPEKMASARKWVAQCYGGRFIGDELARRNFQRDARQGRHAIIGKVEILNPQRDHGMPVCWAAASAA